MWDLLIENVRVIDPAQSLDRMADVAVLGSRIAAVGDSLPGEARLTVKGQGLVLTPGLADIHSHTAGKDFAHLSLPPDECGVRRGVTLVGDAGTAGAANADELLERTRLARTQVRHFINVFPHGIAILPEQWVDDLDFGALAEAIDRHRPRVAGVKLRLMSGFAARYGVAGLEAVKKFSADMGLPLMLHLGTDWEDELPSCWESFCEAVPRLVERGDILSHIYTAKPGALITPDRRHYAALRAAVERGVVLDAAVALTHFSFATARQGMADGFMPDCVSTDLTLNNCRRGVLDLPAVMSRFLALGMPLNDVVACATTAPYRALGVECPRIAEGEEADLTLLEDRRGPVILGEGAESMKAERRLIPYAAIRQGEFCTASAGENLPA